MHSQEQNYITELLDKIGALETELKRYKTASNHLAHWLSTFHEAPGVDEISLLHDALSAT
jgi:hypothetical protein